MVKRAEDMMKLYMSICAAVMEQWRSSVILNREEFNGNAKMIAKLVFKPGCSIGEHIHEGEEEIICIAKGTAIYIDNGTMTTLPEGDSCVVLVDRHMVSEMHLRQRIWKPLQ